MRLCLRLLRFFRLGPLTKIPPHFFYVIAVTNSEYAEVGKLRADHPVNQINVIYHYPSLPRIDNIYDRIGFCSCID